jgi:hypothetical protein
LDFGYASAWGEERKGKKILRKLMVKNGVEVR